MQSIPQKINAIYLGFGISGTVVEERRNMTPTMDSFLKEMRIEVS
jgi:hypothetical protein